MELAEREGIFAAGTGVKLHYRSHRLQSAPFQAVIALIEAPEDRSGLYADLVRQLAPAGYALYSCAHHELRRGPGQPGFLEEWNELYRELDAFLELVRGHEPDAPMFLAGSHVAGQLVMTYALHQPDGLQGVIAWNPRSQAPPSPSPLVSIARALARIWPVFTPTVESRTAHPSAASDLQDAEAGTTSQPSAPEGEVTAATASEISIPLLVLDGGRPGSADLESNDAPPAEANPASLRDVESWLVRVLQTGTD